MSLNSSKNRRRKFLHIAILSLVAADASLAFCAEETVSVADEPLRTNHYEFSLSNSVRAMQGSFDPYGAYHAYPEGTEAWSLMTRFGVSYRFSKKWAAGFSLPVRQNQMQTSTGSSSSTSVGGMNFSIKYHLGGWAHPVIHVGGGPPWAYRHRTMEGDPRAAITEDSNDGMMGGASIHVGAGISRTFRWLRAALDSTIMLPFASTQTNTDGTAGSVSVRRGNRLQLSEGLAYVGGRGWSINGSLRQMWSGLTSADGVDVMGTRSRAFSTSVGASYAPSKNWRLRAGYDTQFPFYAYAVNSSYSPSVTLGMTYVGI
jgi:hypothetical protein